MTTSEPMRRPPRERFAGAEHVFDLAAAAEELRREGRAAPGGHRQVTLWHGDRSSIVLFDFDAGGALPGHQADGVVTIQTIAGEVEVTTNSGSQRLAEGQLLLLIRGVRHDVSAAGASTILVTVHLADGEGRD